MEEFARFYRFDNPKGASNNKDEYSGRWFTEDLDYLYRLILSEREEIGKILVIDIPKNGKNQYKSTNFIKNAREDYILPQELIAKSVEIELPNDFNKLFLEHRKGTLERIIAYISTSNLVAEKAIKISKETQINPNNIKNIQNSLLHIAS